MSAANETEVLNITATTKNAKLSQELCSIMADVAPSFLIRVVGTGSVEKIGDAKLYEEKVSPNVIKNTVFGGIAGFLIAVFIVLMIDFFDNSIKDTPGTFSKTDFRRNCSYRGQNKKEGHRQIKR